MNDPVRETLRQRGCPDFVIRGGLEGLVGMWERTAAEIEQGYQGTSDEFLNDVDARQIIEEVLPAATARQRRELVSRLTAADERFRRATEPLGRCAWGQRNEAKYGYTADRNWWYYRTPPRLRDELNGWLDRGVAPEK